MATEISMNEYREARSSYLGWCCSCNGFTRSRTEPDAENYNCPECGQNEVMGAENAMVCMEIEIV